jgi:hypothetical protein
MVFIVKQDLSGWFERFVLYCRAIVCLDMRQDGAGTSREVCSIVFYCATVCTYLGYSNCLSALRIIFDQTFNRGTFTTQNVSFDRNCHTLSKRVSTLSGRKRNSDYVPTCLKASKAIYLPSLPQQQCMLTSTSRCQNGKYQLMRIVKKWQVSMELWRGLQIVKLPRP